MSLQHEREERLEEGHKKGLEKEYEEGHKEGREATLVKAVESVMESFEVDLQSAGAEHKTLRVDGRVKQ